MIKFISNIAAVISATIFAFCWHVTLILASLGLGSAGMGRWIQTHKTAFLAGAVFLMTASLALAVRERIVKGKNTGLVIFAVALIATAALLAYTKVKNGYLYWKLPNNDIQRIAVNVPKEALEPAGGSNEEGREGEEGGEEEKKP